jgi:hypothetical protein
MPCSGHVDGWHGLRAAGHAALVSEIGGPVDPEMLAAIAHANWLEFVGPPLAVCNPL